MDLSTLKSGSDVRGRALPEKDAPLSADIVFRIGYAFAKTQKAGARISIGRDSRVTGENLLAACARGMAAAGADVQDFGLCTTPAMFMATQLPPQRDAAVMVTASHLPYDMNGLKFFTREGGLAGSDITALLEAAGSADIPADTGSPRQFVQRHFIGEYAEFLSGKLRAFTGGQRPLAGMHIVVDAGNGAGGFYAEMLEQLGANTKGSLYLDPDGMFPNHEPNPENQEALAAISAAVTASHADYGILFDTDCDRAAMVDGSGRPIAGNRLIALISAMLLRDNAGATIVTDSVTSTALGAFIEKHGGHQHRFRRGYKNVIDEALRLNREGADCPLAIETSGHAALRENHFLDDGAYLVTRLLGEAVRLRTTGKTLADLTRDLREPQQVISLRLNITDSDFRATGNGILDALADFALLRPDWHLIPDNVEGVRVHFSKEGENSAWLLMRLSLHEPNMPVQIESDTPNGCKWILEDLCEFLKTCPGIDPAPAQKKLAALV